MTRNVLTAWLTIVVAVPLALEGRSVADDIPEGEYGPGSNVPDASLKLCGSLPDGEEFIPELRTGWAIDQGDGVTLLFSDAALACDVSAAGQAMEDISANCVSAWNYRLTLPSELLAPGTYQLDEYEVGFEHAATFVTDGAGCSSCEGGGMGGGGIAPGANNKGPKATLELFSVDDDCITGRISGLDTGQITPPPPELNGGFHAVRCDTD